MGSAHSLRSFRVSFAVFFMVSALLVGCRLWGCSAGLFYLPRFGVKTGKLIGSLQNFRSVFTFLAFSFMTIPPWVCPVPGGQRAVSLRGVRMGSAHTLSTRSPIRSIRGSVVIRVAPVLWIRVIMASRLAAVAPFR